MCLWAAVLQERYQLGAAQLAAADTAAGLAAQQVADMTQQFQKQLEEEKLKLEDESQRHTNVQNSLLTVIDEMKKEKEVQAAGVLVDAQLQLAGLLEAEARCVVEEMAALRQQLGGELLHETEEQRHLHHQESQV